MKKTICLFLVLAALAGTLSVGVSAAAVDDYTQWKQWDAEWNETPAWPADQFPYATLHNMSDAGCLVTAIAMLMRQHNVVTGDVTTFNPRICCDRLKEAGAFDNSGGLIFEKVALAYPGFVFQGFREYSLATLKTLFDSGYACILKVNGTGGYFHYVAVHDIQDNNVLVLNPGANTSSLAELGVAYEIIVYEPTPAEYAGQCVKYPSRSNLHITKKTYAMTQPCSSGTDSSSLHAETISAGTVLTSIGLYRNTVGNLWYQVIAPQSGQPVFIPSSHTEHLGANVSDVTLQNVSAPSVLDVGSCFPLGGTVTANGSNLTGVSAYVYLNSNVSGEAMTGASDIVSGNSYNLFNSSVDYATKFNELPAGNYTYVVRATVGKTYYAESEKVLGEVGSQEILLHSSRFTVKGGDVSSLMEEYVNVEEPAEPQTNAPAETQPTAKNSSGIFSSFYKLLSFFRSF